MNQLTKYKKIQIFENLKKAPRTHVLARATPVLPRFAKAMISHRLGNEIEWNKHQTCSNLTHEHNHGL